MIDNILIEISALLRDGTVAIPLLAFLGGFFTSLTPCSLTNLPFIIAYLSKGSYTPKNAFKHSLVFAIGNAITFSILGLVASLLGQMISLSGRWTFLFLGGLMILLSLQQFGVIDFISPFLGRGEKAKQKSSGALVLGIVSGIFSSPCATPVLIALMIMVTGAGVSALKSLLVFLIYGLGHGITVITVGTLSSMGYFLGSKNQGKFSQIVQYGFGILFLVFGLYLLYLGF